MSARYEAAPFLTRETGELRRVFGVIDHSRKPFDWARSKDGRALSFATREEAQAWIDQSQKRPGETATFSA